MNFKGSITIVLLFCLTTASGQDNPKSEMKVALKAQKAYDNFNYPKVIELYEDLVNGSVKSQRNLANSYWKIGDLANTERAYSRIMDLPDRTADDILNYSLLLRQLGEYEESIKLMTEYSKLQKDDPFVNEYLEYPKAHETLIDSSPYHDIVNLAFNSGYQDLGVSYYGDESVVFMSNRESFKPIKRRYNASGLPFYDMFEAKVFVDIHFLELALLISFICATLPKRSIVKCTTVLQAFRRIKKK